MSGLTDALAADPQALSEADYWEAFQMKPAEVEQVQLAGLRRRFDALRPRLPAVDRLAQGQGITEIRAVEDIVPLLFPHTVYKSYPLSFLEQGRFDRLTKWLQGLTTCDLSGVDVAGVDTIDGWIGAIERATELRPIHSFGTTGKLSFIPRTRAQVRKTVRINARAIRDFHGSGSGPDLLVSHMPLISPSYRYGASAIIRGMEAMAEDYAGGFDNSLFLHPDAYFSADIASLAGRMKAAEARGEQGQLSLSPALLARREEFARREQSAAQDMDRFFAEAARRFGGQDVFMFAVWPILFEWAEEGLKRGVRNVFGTGSVLTTGGGSKGRVLPADYKETIFKFLGFERHFEFFGMSELMANAPRCEEGNFHVPPVIVPFVLDPDSGAPLDRTGTATGRLALMDLLPDSYWGGFVTGDEVTLSGPADPCACGRTGHYIHSTIRRFSEAQGGDDKINCAGAPEAHDKAVEFLLAGQH